MALSTGGQIGNMLGVNPSGGGGIGTGSPWPNVKPPREGLIGGSGLEATGPPTGAEIGATLAGMQQPGWRNFQLGQGTIPGTNQAAIGTPYLGQGGGGQVSSNALGSAINMSPGNTFSGPSDQEIASLGRGRFPSVWDDALGGSGDYWGNVFGGDFQNVLSGYGQDFLQNTYDQWFPDSVGGDTDTGGGTTAQPEDAFNTPGGLFRVDPGGGDTGDSTGLIPPPEGSINTQAFETGHNTITGETRSVPTGGYSAAPDSGWVRQDW